MHFHFHEGSYSSESIGELASLGGLVPRLDRDYPSPRNVLSKPWQLFF